jgi:hypothetical protein
MTVIDIKPLAAGDPARYAELARTLALLVGLMAVAAWLLRLGFVADLLSRPILVGYMAGVALIMITDQLQRVTGVPVAGQAFFAQVGSFARGISHTQPVTLAIALSVLAFLLLLRWRWPRAPGPLLAVLLATAIVAALGLSGRQAAVVGPIPGRLPVPGLPAVSLRLLRELLLPAFTVLIGALARVPGQQQREQDGHRGRHGQQDPGVLACRGCLGDRRTALRAPGPRPFPYSGARRDRRLRRRPAGRRLGVPAPAGLPPHRAADLRVDLYRRAGL